VRIGFIDWTEEDLHFYIFDKKGGQYILADTISIPLKNGINQDSLSSIAKSRADHIYLSVPVTALSLREVSFPFSDRNKINDTISYELEGILLGNIRDYSVDHVVTESSENGSKVLAVCLEKTKLREIIEIFASRAALATALIFLLSLILPGLRRSPSTPSSIEARANR